MTKKGTRLISGIIEILLGIFIGIISIVFYLNSNYEGMDVVKYIYFSVEMIIIPLACLVLIGFGIKNLIIKDKEEKQ